MSGDGTCALPSPFKSYSITKVLSINIFMGIDNLSFPDIICGGCIPLTPYRFTPMACALKG